MVRPDSYMKNMTKTMIRQALTTDATSASRRWCLHLIAVIVFALTVRGTPLAFAQEVKVVTSSKAGDRFAPKPTTRFLTSSGTKSQFQITETVHHQTVAGFGASFLEAGMVCINSLPEDGQEKVLRALFDPVNGVGFSAMKTVVAGTDFMSAGPWYSYDDVPGDVEMKKFSIARDLGTNGLVNYIKRARKHGRFVLQAPMDYPPDWMLFDVNKNQDVNPQYFDALALYYLRYLQEYQKQGIFIDYLSLFNEPGIYTKIPYPKIRDLIKNHVGPLLRKEGIQTKLQLSEASSRDDASRKYPVVLDDPEARKYISVLPYHGYDLQHFNLIASLRERYPDLPLWMTELCHAYQAGTPKSMKLPRYDFEDGEFWANQIFSDLEAGASAWIYWNMILDQNGGPWLVSPVHGNPDPNVQHPVVIIDRKTQQVTYTGLYYYLGHFSKFIRPRSIRIGATGNVRDVRCLAFQDQNHQIVVQLLNSNTEDTQVGLDWHGQCVSLTLPAVSITTCQWPTTSTR